MSKTNEELIHLMDAYKLSRQEVATRLGVSVSSVESWTADPTQEEYEPMPESELRHLQYDLQSENTIRTLF